MAIEFKTDFDGSYLVAVVSGSLGLADVAGLHLKLLKALAEQPSVLIVDLAEVTVTEPLALAVLTAVNRQSARWPGTPVLFTCPPSAIRDLLARPAYLRLSVFDSVAAARDHADADPHLVVPAISDELLPLAGAARHGRNLATEACLRWELPHLVGPACLIASELITNAVEHANTMMTMRLSLRSRYLTLAVRDGSPIQPILPAEPPPTNGVGGRGLLLVDSVAHSWGFVPSADGKVVWASLRLALE